MSVIIFITNKAENTAQDGATLLERQTLTHWSHALRSRLIFVFKYKEKLLQAFEGEGGSMPAPEDFPLSLFNLDSRWQLCYMWSIFQSSHFGSDKVSSLSLTLLCKIIHFKFSSCQQLRQRVVIYITKGVLCSKGFFAGRLFKRLLLLLQLKHFSLEQVYLPEAFQFLSWEPSILCISHYNFSEGKKSLRASINQGKRREHSAKEKHGEE